VLIEREPQEKAKTERLKLLKSKVSKWTRVVDSGGGVAPSPEIQVQSNPGEKRGWNIPNSQSVESQNRSRPLVAKGNVYH
jgi:hypothetical protein